MKLSKKILAAAAIFAAGFSVLFADSGKPGTFDNAAPKGMEAVLSVDAKLNPSNDELVVYYVRPDANYKPWALWCWAPSEGDGNYIWPFSQEWKVLDGVGYMRFKLDGSGTGGNKPVTSKGVTGLIVRQKGGWIKDCPDDRIWNVKTSNKVAIFSNDPNTYAALPYKPSIKHAELTSLDQVKVTLSGRFGLDTDGGISGFVLSSESGKSFKIKSVVNALNPSKVSENYTASILVNLAENVAIGDSLVLSNASFLGDAKVSNIDLAVKIANSTSPAVDEVLGCTYSAGKASFKLWAPTSSSAVLNLYKTAKAQKPDYKVSMNLEAATGVWSCDFSETDPDGYFYDYTIENSKGKVTVLDPYAKSMAAHDGKGGVGRACVINLSSPKAGVQTADYVKLEKREDAVIYEVSVRDFTISPDANVKNTPGTYKAFIEKIPYLKELGITHVQLMPVLNFYFNDENNKSYESSGNVNGNNYNWGYDPHNYFTPEGWFASDANDPYCRIRELRELIDECHKAGIGVLLDVVYNHMAGTQFLDDIVPGYYFRMDDKGGFKSNSGCGNDTATERKMMKKIVVDSTAYWVKNYKVDGFRFDLMGLMEASSVVDSYDECAKINPSALFEGEGWKMYNGEAGTVGLDQNYMLHTDKIAVFNDEFRDMIKAGGMNETGRGLVTKRYAENDRFYNEMTGNPMSNYQADQPGDNLNYLVCHDGLTLHDCIVHNLKLDEYKNRNEIVQRIKIANFLEFTSQGIAFLHAGQERGRTKPNVNKVQNETIGNFVRNSYDSSDNINQFVWKIDSDYQNVLEYTKGLIQLRKKFDVFRMSDAKAVKKNISLVKTGDDSGLAFGLKIKDGKEIWLCFVNIKQEETKLNAGVSLENSVIYLDSDNVNVEGIKNPKGVSVSGKSVILDPLTACVIRVK